MMKRSHVRKPSDGYILIPTPKGSYTSSVELTVVPLRASEQDNASLASFDSRYAIHRRRCPTFSSSSSSVITSDFPPQLSSLWTKKGKTSQAAMLNEAENQQTLNNKIEEASFASNSSSSRGENTEKRVEGSLGEESLELHLNQQESNAISSPATKSKGKDISTPILQSPNHQLQSGDQVEKDCKTPFDHNIEQKNSMNEGDAFFGEENANENEEILNNSSLGDNRAANSQESANVFSSNSSESGHNENGGPQKSVKFAENRVKRRNQRIFDESKVSRFGSNNSRMQAIVLANQARLAKKDSISRASFGEPFMPKYSPSFDKSAYEEEIKAKNGSLQNGGDEGKIPSGEFGLDYETEYSHSYSSDNLKSFQEQNRVSSGEIYRVICENLRQNLSLIKKHEKPTLIKETNALYLSLIDAAVNGPQKISMTEAEQALGVSKAAIYKVNKHTLKLSRALKKDQGKNKAKASEEVLRQKRPRSRHGSFVHGDDFFQAHSAEKDEQSMGSQLRAQFQLFATFGADRHKDGSHIMLTQIDRWFRQSGLLDGGKITTTDTAILFKKLSGAYPWLTYKEWLKFIELLAETHDLNPNEIRRKLVLCGPPITSSSSTELEESPLISRLTDPSLYPGAHRHRFDSFGRGLGLDGRREPQDVLSLQWSSIPKGDETSGQIMPVPPTMEKSENVLRRQQRISQNLAMDW